MAHISQQWSCGDELAGRLRWHVHHCLRQGDNCSIMLFRSLEHPENGDSAPDAARALAYLAERLTSVIRRTDAIEIEASRALAIVLAGAGRDGARAVYQRLRDLLTPPPLPGDTPFVLGLSYATGAEEWDSECALDAALRGACIPRVLVTLGLPADYQPRRWLGAAAAATPRHDRPAATRRAPYARPAVAAKRSGRHLRLVASGERPPRTIEALREHARVLGVPYVQLPAIVPAACAEALTPELARELGAVPIGRSRTTLTVAMRNPHDMAAIGRLRAATGLAIFPVLASPDELNRVLGNPDALAEG